MHLQRTSAIASALRDLLPATGLRALEVGAGTGLLSFALADHLGPILATDPSIGMVAALEDKIRQTGSTTLRALRCGDDLAGADGPFDLILSQMALHHIPDVPGFLVRAASRLPSGGWLAIADLDLEDGSFHGPGVTDVHFGFDRAALADQLAQAGFEGISFRTVHVMSRNTEAGLREYPIFLATARRH
jgi:2-polyprenyl-3-methyl-5-hydroxy-6-metoxy-1,4-benzoquinol methylase